MAMARTLWWRALAGGRGARSISTTPALCAAGTKKGKIVQDAKKTGYKKGGRGTPKKGGAKDSANKKDAGVGASLYAQLMAKPTRVEAKAKISDEEKERMLAEMKRLAKETSRILMRELREKQYFEFKAFKLRQAAIAALPAELRAEIKPFPPPRKKRMPPTLLPPIDGYSEDVGITKKAAMTRKRR